MATFIQLKQLESSSALQLAADLGTDFSQSVIDVVSASIVGVLPNNLVSSSIQIANFGFATTQSLNTLTQSVSVLSGSVVSYNNLVHRWILHLQQITKFMLLLLKLLTKENFNTYI